MRICCWISDHSLATTRQETGAGGPRGMKLIASRSQGPAVPAPYPAGIGATRSSAQPTPSRQRLPAHTHAGHPKGPRATSPESHRVTMVIYYVWGGRGLGHGLSHHSPGGRVLGHGLPPYRQVNRVLGHGSPHFFRYLGLSGS